MFVFTEDLWTEFAHRSLINTLGATAFKIVCNLSISEGIRAKVSGKYPIPMFATSLMVRPQIHSKISDSLKGTSVKLSRIRFS